MDKEPATKHDIEALHALIKQLETALQDSIKKQSQIYYLLMGSTDAQGRRTPGALQNQDELIVAVWGDRDRNVTGLENRTTAVETKQEANERVWIKLAGITTGGAAVVMFCWKGVEWLLGKK